MSFTVIAYKVKPAPKEKFPNNSNIINGWELATILNIYGNEELETVWDVKELYERFQADLEDEEAREELLQDLKDDGATLDDLYRIRDFFKVCAENDYILGSWY